MSNICKFKLAGTHHVVNLSFFRFKGTIPKGGKQHRTLYIPGANIFRLSCGNGFCLLELSQA